MRPIELNELPRYSGWIAELLSGRSHKRPKDREQVLREFGVDKWGTLLAKWKENPGGIDDVRNWEIPSGVAQAALVGDRLVLMSAKESFDHYVSVVERSLLDDRSAHLVEIGCGYGSVLFELINRGKLQYDSMTGLEYTQEGVELATCLAARHKYEVTLGRGDFNSTPISTVNIIPSSDIMTSFSFCYVRDSAFALSNIIKLRPRRVLHFEPVFQHYSEQAMLGLLQRMYLEVNDYNLGLRTELAKLEEKGAVEILKEEPIIFGANCLLPASLLVWRPRIS